VRQLWQRADCTLPRPRRHLSRLYNLLPRDGMATKSCMVFRCDLFDGVIAEEMLKALQPAELEHALEAHTNWDRGIRGSYSNGRCGWNVPNMKSRSRSGATRRSIPPIVWWQAHENADPAFTARASFRSCLNQRCFCRCLRAALVVSWLGIDTQLTPSAPPWIG
jgi:hypothetical protein